MSDNTKKVAYQEMCCREKYFTCGNNQQYAKVMQILCDYTYNDHCTHGGFDALVYMTWICSDVGMVLISEVRRSMIRLFKELKIAVR